MIRSLMITIVIAWCHTANAEDSWSANPTDFINHFTAVAIEDILTADISDVEKRKRFRKLFRDGFDIPAIGRFVLARNWRRADDSEKQSFVALFEDVIVYTWSRRFSEYDGQEVNILGTAPDGKTGTLVLSEIVDDMGQSASVQWRLRQRQGGLRIVDIIVEGVSMAITYRQDYASVMRQFGGLGGLITQLRAQVSSLEKS